MATKESIKQQLIDNGWSADPGLLAELIFGYVLDERERCIDVIESAKCGCKDTGCYDFPCFEAEAVKTIRGLT